MLYVMQAPLRNQTILVASGATYVSDNNGIIVNVASVADVISLQAAGCVQLVPQPSNLVAKLIGANFNETIDQQLTLYTLSKYRVTKITVTNASISLTSAVGGLYNQAGKAGTPLVASSQAYSALTAGNLALDLTLNFTTTVLAALTPIYFSLSTSQGAAATADIFVYADQYPAN